MLLGLSSSNRGTGGGGILGGSSRPRTWTGSTATSNTANTNAGAALVENASTHPGVQAILPTSTTKALLLSIAVPRVYRVYIPPKEQPKASLDAQRKSKVATKSKIPYAAVTASAASAAASAASASAAAAASAAASAASAAAAAAAAASGLRNNPAAAQKSGPPLNGGNSSLRVVPPIGGPAARNVPSFISRGTPPTSSSDSSNKVHPLLKDPSDGTDHPLMRTHKSFDASSSLGTVTTTTSHQKRARMMRDEAGRMAPTDLLAVTGDGSANNNNGKTTSFNSNTNTENSNSNSNSKNTNTEHSNTDPAMCEIPAIVTVPTPASSDEEAQSQLLVMGALSRANTPAGSVVGTDMDDFASFTGAVDAVLVRSESENDDEDLIRVVNVVDDSRNLSESVQEHDIGYVENEDDETGRRQDSIVEHVVTREEMDMIVKIDVDEEEKEENAKMAAESSTKDGVEAGQLDAVVEGVVAENPTSSSIARVDSSLELGPPSVEPPHHRRVPTDSSIITVASEVIKSFFGVINKNNDDFSTSYMSKEEAIAAIRHYDPPNFASNSAIAEVENEDEADDLDDYDRLLGKDAPSPVKTAEAPGMAAPTTAVVSNGSLKPNTEIKLEELLRLTFRNLHSENHFYNVPIYTDIQTRAFQADGEEPESWVELSVMVKQVSIGLILERMERIGVGSSVGTIAIYKAELLRTVEVVPQAVSKEESEGRKSEGNTVNNVDGTQTPSGEDAAEKLAKIEVARAEWKNAASRLRVEQVKEQIEEQAELSLDYLALLTIASILAGIGLITDNAVVIVASMLVSPIMGPVMGMTFGSRVLDWDLAAKGFWHETISLLLAVLIGAIIGICTSFAPSADTWPTEQMSSRGDTTGLVTGLAIAIPSGMGVALSLLGNNTASLVGVAISASLLPPAVNAGICWVYAILIRVGSVESSTDDDFNLIACISFALTVLNIVCIWVSGIIMFQIKEVAPTRAKSAFWSHDIKVARAIQKGSKGVNLDAIKEGLQDAIKKERKDKDTQQSVVGAKKRKKLMNFTFNMAENPVDDIAPIVNIEEYAGPHALPDDIKYCSLEEIGRYFEI